jgi:hypothetical protein
MRALKHLLGFALCSMLGACIPPGDREQCDDALEIMCACSTKPCDSEDPPAIVRAMQRCDEDDIRPSNQQNNVHICIAEAGQAFCGVLDGLSVPTLWCEADCSYNTTCKDELYDECTDYQFRRCDVPSATEVSP